MTVAFDDVEVRIAAEPVVSAPRAALALGSNLGDRMATLQRRWPDLAGSTGHQPGRRSSVYETDPVGGPEQGAYLNAVLVVDTDLDPSGAAGAGARGRGTRKGGCAWSGGGRAPSTSTCSPSVPWSATTRT